MDKETREFLENMQEGINGFRNEIQEFRKETNSRFDGLEGEVKEIKTMLGELDPKNANRHIELKESIKQLRKDLSTVEIVTASNYSDIARLKSVK
jgi:uncharacterized coiled-coil DUF342 family protein